MASTTKIMTALVVLESLPLDKRISVPSVAVGTEGSSLYLKEGEIFTVSDLLYALLLRSANDVAVTLAHAVSGSVEAFADAMNEKAARLGLRNTHFKNPHGLDDPEHYTTARDLASLTAYALKNPVFAQITACKQARLLPIEGTVRLVTNHNKLLRLHPSSIGIKTGFTKKSGRCLVGASEENGLLLISVTLDAPDDWNDHIALFRYGTERLERRTPYESGEYTVTIPVVGGTKNDIILTNTAAITYVSEKGTSGTISAEYNYFAVAPITKGQVLGTLIFTAENGETVVSDLCATEDISAQKIRKGLFH